MIQIRRATLEDAQAVSALFDAYRQFYDMPPDASLALRFISERLGHNQSTIFIAERDDRATGFCQIYPGFCSVFAGPICILSDLFVDPSDRGTGAGKALLEQAETFAARSGALRITLQTARTNALAQALYEANGWTRNTTLYGYSKWFS
ncbi:MAG: GNAT family N-acetyltransferase [Alteraurantiacibacter sp.]